MNRDIALALLNCVKVQVEAVERYLLDEAASTPLTSEPPAPSGCPHVNTVTIATMGGPPQRLCPDCNEMIEP